MPYYSELGIYMSPTSSYVGSYVPGPYSNHSSLLPSNFTRPPPSLLKPRNVRGYKPLLATITENHSSLRRLNSPKLLPHSSPKVIVAKPIKINTADIDVSLNKYKKYERPKVVEERVERKSPSPKDTTDTPRTSTEQKDAKPNKVIRRDRPTVRLRTIHTDMVPSDISSSIKRWRDNFEPQELYGEEREKEKEKEKRKTPGELLKEKFLIRSREDIFKAPEKKVSRRGSKKSGVQKTPSFHDICKAITTDQIDEELNPGQPIEIQRKQSRQISTEEIINEIRRNSADLGNEIHQVNHQNLEVTEVHTENKQALNETRGSVKRKKKLTKKKSNEKVVLTPQPVTSDGDENKSLLQRRPTQKKIRRTSTSSSIGSDIIDVDPEVEKAYQEAIRDISQVEIEKIKIKPKPIITATVDVEEKPVLKVVVDEVEVIESPKPKKTSKFKFNVIVEEIEEAKRKSVKAPKCKVEEQKGTVHIPKPKDILVSNILKKHQNAHAGQVLENITEQPKDEANTEYKHISKEAEFAHGNVNSTHLIDTANVEEVDTDGVVEIPESKKRTNNQFPVTKKTQLKKSNSTENVAIPCTKKELRQAETGVIICNTHEKIKEEPKNVTSTENKNHKPHVDLKNTNGDKWRDTMLIAESRDKPELPLMKAEHNQSDETSKSIVTKKDDQIQLNVDLNIIGNKKDSSVNILTKSSSFESSKLQSATNKITDTVKKSSSDEKVMSRQSSESEKNGSSISMKKDPLISKLQLRKKPIIPIPTSSDVERKSPQSPKIKSVTIQDKSVSKLQTQTTNTKKNENKITNAFEVSEDTEGDFWALIGPRESVYVKPKKVITPIPPSTPPTDHQQYSIVEQQKEDTKPETLQNEKKPEFKHQDKVGTTQQEKIQELKTENKSESPQQNKKPDHITLAKSETLQQENKPLPKTENKAEALQEEKTQASISDKLTPKKVMPSKRSLVNKANKDDPDLDVFIPPEPEPKPEPEPEPEQPSFVPLQSNRLSLSNFMHPFKKPEQLDVCPVEIYATPKVIRHRHYPRPRHPVPPPVQESESEAESEDETTESEETSSDDDSDVNMVYGSNKVGASTSSNDSGFDSGVPGSRNKGSTESRDSPTSNPSRNPALALDPIELLEEFSQSSTYAGFQKSGRITPPATTIPRFRKYCVEDFNFLKVLGKGSFGKVLLAELKNTEYYYAIKCLKKDVVLEDDDVECTLIERKVLALATKHPYLCHLLCTFQTESHLFFVMEYLNGGDLMFHIQQEGRFPEVRARFYGAEIVSGLKFLHNKGIVYRDLKLDNILLDFDGHVRIADFGMCKLQIFLDRMADTFCGTPDYMAPEIIKGQHYNQCVDWWSFGVLLYEMLIGQSPFSGCDEDELFWSICNEKPVLPRFLTAEASAVLLLFLEKDANKRLGNKFCPAGDIQDQAFFKPIQWDKLEARMLEPPFKPHLLHPLDTQYFDKTFTIEKAKLTPIEQNILQSMDQAQFQGFSYTNPNATDK